MEPHDRPPDAVPEPRHEQGGLTPDQAMQMLTVETNKRRRVATATHSGSRLVTAGLVLGVLAAVAAWLAPPEGVLAWTPTVAGALAAVLLAFGGLRLFAAWHLSGR